MGLVRLRDVLRVARPMTYENPYSRPYKTWDAKADYHAQTYCPYCGHFGRDLIVQYEGGWTRLECKQCKRKYKVRQV